jgi:hypothetical protein
LDDKKKINLDEYARRVAMRDEPMGEHQNHLCYLSRKRELAMVGKLAKGSQYMCLLCGRAAENPKNLCMPYKI